MIVTACQPCVRFNRRPGPCQPTWPAEDDTLHSCVPIFVGLGSNVGNPHGKLQQAVDLLNSLDAFRNVRVSNLRVTTPVGNIKQPNFVNAVVAAESDWSPECLLVLLHIIESSLGRDRTREVRWGPRSIDLDLLMVGDQVTDSPSLTLPHPEMTRRRFVLEPLVELAPEAIHPVNGLCVRALLESVQ
jgi:2-amino-4-hydroxy-6-hydroxymethyldihydropteridine diphosphokinase